MSIVRCRATTHKASRADLLSARLVLMQPSAPGGMTRAERLSESAKTPRRTDGPSRSENLRGEDARDERDDDSDDANVIRPY